MLLSTTHVHAPKICVPTGPKNNAHAQVQTIMRTHRLIKSCARPQVNKIMRTCRSIKICAHAVPKVCTVDLGRDLHKDVLFMFFYHTQSIHPSIIYLCIKHIFVIHLHRDASPIEHLTSETKIKKKKKIKYSCTKEKCV